MKKFFILSIFSIIALVVGVLSFQPQPAFADCAGADTSIINCDDGGEVGGGISSILKLVFTILTYGVGALGILGVIIVGIMYMTARDSTEQVAKAKKRILEIAVGMIMFAGFGTIMNWLVPGGVLISSSGSSNSNSSNESQGGTSSSAQSGSSNGPSSSSSTSGAETSASSSGNRQTGSESMDGSTGSVGSGNEGWVER